MEENICPFTEEKCEYNYNCLHCQFYPEELKVQEIKENIEIENLKKKWRKKKGDIFNKGV